jgi:hypothetical protein
MVGSQSKVIGQHEYTVTQLTATPAYTLLCKLMKIAGPAFGALAAGSGSGNMGEAVSIAIRELVARMDEAEVKAIVNQLIGTVLVKIGNTDTPLSRVFESHFRGGNLSEMFQVLGFALEVNYSDFFGGLERAKEKLGAFVAPPSKSPITSGGMHGA